MGLPRDVSLFKDGQSCVWWIVPYGIKSRLKGKLLQHLSSFKQICQQEKCWGGGVMVEGTGEEPKVVGGGGEKQAGGQLAFYTKISCRLEPCLAQGNLTHACALWGTFLAALRADHGH